MYRKATLLIMASMVALLALALPAAASPQSDCATLEGTFTPGGGKPTCIVKGWSTVVIEPPFDPGTGIIPGSGVYVSYGYISTYELNKGGGVGNTGSWSLSTQEMTGENKCTDERFNVIDPSNCAGWL